MTTDIHQRGAVSERARIRNNFTYRPPVRDQAQRYETLRKTARDFALLIEDLCPSSRERSVALTNLEQSVMWANAAIARNEDTGGD